MKNILLVAMAFAIVGCASNPNGAQIDEVDKYNPSFQYSVYHKPGIAQQLANVKKMKVKNDAYVTRLASLGQDVIIEKDSYQRFLEEKMNVEFILLKKQLISGRIYQFLGERGFQLVWEVPLDCSVLRGMRIKGKTVEEVVSKFVNEYNLKATIYSNRHVQIEPTKHILATCGSHNRVNFEGGA